MKKFSGLGMAALCDIFDNVIRFSIPEQRDQNKSNGSSDEHLAETIETLLSSKVVREKRQELARKLDALRRKYDKDKRPVSSKFYVSNKLVKRLSSRNM